MFGFKFSQQNHLLHFARCSRGNLSLPSSSRGEGERLRTYAFEASFDAARQPTWWPPCINRRCGETAHAPESIKILSRNTWSGRTKDLRFQCCFEMVAAAAALFCFFSRQNQIFLPHQKLSRVFLTTDAGLTMQQAAAALLGSLSIVEMSIKSKSFYKVKQQHGPAQISKHRSSSKYKKR